MCAGGVPHTAASSPCRKHSKRIKKWPVEQKQKKQLGKASLLTPIDCQNWNLPFFSKAFALLKALFNLTSCWADTHGRSCPQLSVPLYSSRYPALLDRAGHESVNEQRLDTVSRLLGYTNIKSKCTACLKVFPHKSGPFIVKYFPFYPSLPSFSKVVSIVGNLQ